MVLIGLEVGVHRELICFMNLSPVERPFLFPKNRFYFRNFCVGLKGFGYSLIISCLFIVQKEDMSSIKRFQTSGLNSFWCKSFVSSLTTKVLAKVTAIFVSAQVCTMGL